MAGLSSPCPSAGACMVQRPLANSYSASSSCSQMDIGSVHCSCRSACGVLRIESEVVEVYPAPRCLALVMLPWRCLAGGTSNQSTVEPYAPGRVFRLDRGLVVRGKGEDQSFRLTGMVGYHSLLFALAEGSSQILPRFHGRCMEAGLLDLLGQCDHSSLLAACPSRRDSAL